MGPLLIKERHCFHKLNCNASQTSHHRFEVNSRSNEVPSELKVNGEQGFLCCSEEKKNPCVHTNDHAVTIFNRSVRVHKHRLIGAKFQVSLSKCIVPPNTVLLPQCFVANNPSKIVFCASVLIQTPLIHQQLSQI